MFISKVSGSVPRVSRRRLLLACGVATVAIAVTACASGSAPATPTAPAVVPAATLKPAAPPTATAAPVIVKMNDQFKFDPAAITIAKGTTVTWQGEGTQPHTVTFDPAKALNKAHVVMPSGAEAFDSGVVNPGAAYSHTFTVAGDYSYVCIPHEAMGMLGTVKVT